MNWPRKYLIWLDNYNGRVTYELVELTLVNHTDVQMLYDVQGWTLTYSYNIKTYGISEYLKSVGITVNRNFNVVNTKMFFVDLQFRFSRIIRTIMAIISAVRVVIRTFLVIIRVVNVVIARYINLNDTIGFDITFKKDFLLHFYLPI